MLPKLHVDVTKSKKKRKGTWEELKGLRNTLAKNESNIMARIEGLEGDGNDGDST